MKIVRLSRCAALAVVGALTLSVSQAALTNPPMKTGDKYYVQGNEQCVAYVRRFVKFRSGVNLASFSDKKNIVNSSTAKAGRAAIITVLEKGTKKPNEYGHIALVTDVDDSGSSRSITIAEHNWPMGAKTSQYRKATCGSNLSDCEKQLSIFGYYKP